MMDVDELREKVWMNAQQRRQEFWMDIVRMTVNIYGNVTESTTSADAALKAFDAQFKPKSQEELQAIFAKGQP